MNGAEESRGRHRLEMETETAGEPLNLEKEIVCYTDKRREEKTVCFCREMETIILMLPLHIHTHAYCTLIYNTVYV